MPRTARASAGGLCYHVLNRGNAGSEVFHEPRDYADYIELLCEEVETRNVRLLAYCLLPDHFHMVFWPRKDGDLSRWMQWLSTTHVRRYHGQHQTSGHIWEGRFRAFPIQPDEHLLTVLRFVEQNPLWLKELKAAQARAVALVVGRQESDRRGAGRAGTSPDRSRARAPRPGTGCSRSSSRLTAEELAMVRHSIIRGTPFGDPKWVQRIVAKLGLESTVRPRGRPRKTPVE